jgi:predicted transcriptional regulator of viral defense system
MYRSSMKKDDFLEQLKYHKLEVFNIHDAARIFGKPERYVSSRLTTMKQIKRVRKGLYYLEGTELSKIASAIIAPSYISLISAFNLLGVTTQIPTEIQVISPVQHKTLFIGQTRIKFIRFRKDRMFGFSLTDLGMIADLEKAIIDSLYLNTFIGEAEDVVEGNSGIIPDRISEYAILMRSGAVINRLGHLLEKFGYDCEKIKNFRSDRYVNFGENGQLKDIKWRVRYAE